MDLIVSGGYYPQVYEEYPDCDSLIFELQMSRTFKILTFFNEESRPPLCLFLSATKLFGCAEGENVLLSRNCWKTDFFLGKKTEMKGSKLLISYVKEPRTFFVSS